MIALVTGASSGIGFEISKYLSNYLNFDIIAVGQNIERLEELKKVCKTKVIIESLDLSKNNNCINLYEKYKEKNINILINSAGIGAIGEYIDMSISKDMELINLNIIATNTLTKLFLKDMLKKDSGYILNVASSAAFAPGPLMATYYSTKAYILKLTTSINKELRSKKSNVIVSVLCPGPVKTDFNTKLNVNYSVTPISAEYVAKYSISKLLKGKKVIVPGIKNKIGIFASKFLPNFILEQYIYNMQNNKKKKI